MRAFIRHPTDIPMEHSVRGAVENAGGYLKDVAAGGLSFRTDICYPSGTILLVRIPIREPAFEAEGEIIRCEAIPEGYEVGVAFREPSTEQALRMVEQVAYIEHYRRMVRETEGRELTSNEAAREWISRFAADFPR